MANLYLLRQDVNDAYDTYDSCVVVADTEDGARLIPPNDWMGDRGLSNTWAAPEDVSVEYLGVADPSRRAGEVVCASFNAG